MGILKEGWTPEAPLEDLDDVEHEARPNLHQRAVLFNNLGHRAMGGVRPLTLGIELHSFLLRAKHPLHYSTHHHFN